MNSHHRVAADIMLRATCDHAHILYRIVSPKQKGVMASAERPLHPLAYFPHDAGSNNKKRDVAPGTSV